MHAEVLDLGVLFAYLPRPMRKHQNPATQQQRDDLSLCEPSGPGLSLHIAG
jgi:hypothetical protein